MTDEPTPTRKCSICHRQLHDDEGRRLTFVISRDNPRITTQGLYCSDECIHKAIAALRLGLTA